MLCRFWFVLCRFWFVLCVVCRVLCSRCLVFAQVLLRALQVLRGALGRLARRLEVLDLRAQDLLRALQVLHRALRRLRGRLGRLRRRLADLRLGLVEIRSARGVAVGVQLGRRRLLPVGHAVPDRARRVAGGRREHAVLVADRRDAVELDRTGADTLRVVVPVTIGRHDGEVLLARVLNGIGAAGGAAVAHAGVDAVGLAAVVAADACQAFTGRRRAAGLLREELVEPEVALGAVEVV